MRIGVRFVGKVVNSEGLQIHDEDDARQEGAASQREREQGRTKNEKRSTHHLLSIPPKIPFRIVTSLPPTPPSFFPNPIPIGNSPFSVPTPPTTGPGTFFSFSFSFPSPAFVPPTPAPVPEPPFRDTMVPSVSADLTSQTRTVQSAEPETRRADSDEKARELMVEVWPDIFLMRREEPRSQRLMV